MKTLLVFFNIFLVAHVKPSKLTMPSCHVTWFLPMSLALWHLITEGYWDINGRASLQALLSKISCGNDARPGGTRCQLCWELGRKSRAQVGRSGCTLTKFLAATAARAEIRDTWRCLWKTTELLAKSLLVVLCFKLISVLMKCARWEDPQCNIFSASHRHRVGKNSRRTLRLCPPHASDKP